MKGFLLDTNICIFAMRDKYGVNERLESIDPQQCFSTSTRIPPFFTRFEKKWGRAM